MKKKITVIEDSNDHSQMISHLLSSHDVNCANNIVDFHNIQNNHPDVIVLDDHLHSGFRNELYYSLKDNPLTKNIPVILMTDKDTLLNSIAPGFNDCFIVKPFNPGYLVHKIINLIDAA